MHLESNFKHLKIFLIGFFIFACNNEEDKKDTSIAIEDKVFDITISSSRPSSYNYNDPTATIGSTDSDGETRILLAIPQILNLYREDIILSSIANIEIHIITSSVDINPENIELSFIDKSWTPYASWNSRFSLAEGQEWSNPGGDIMDLESVSPSIEKAPDGSQQKKLIFNITKTLVEAVSQQTEIQGFLLRAKSDPNNANNTLKVFTSNYSGSYAPKAVLSFNKSEVIE
ncbi:MAG: DNRLRE domain-containing protein [Proteobacteria bacterium]|nr:DNRLRE domain-containing protein [Pseudomonadota bacterium]